MDIILIGHGRMGQAVEEEALLGGHHIVACFDTQQGKPFSRTAVLPQADVCIEFTIAEEAYNNCLTALEAGYPVVSGTTGWNEGVKKLQALSEQNGWSFFYAPNYSIGVNLLYSLNRHLANLLTHVNGYLPSIEERHHIFKKDAPSGTAIALANDLIDIDPSYTNWAPAPPAIEDNHIIPIVSVREGQIPGYHGVTFTSPVDRITIEHEAFSRKGLAQGVLLAADYATKHKGALDMKQMLDITE